MPTGQGRSVSPRDRATRTFYHPAGSVSTPYRPWSDRFLKELQGQVKRTGEINVKVAAELVDVPRRKPSRPHPSVCGKTLFSECNPLESEAETKTRKK